MANWNGNAVECLWRLLHSLAFGWRKRIRPHRRGVGSCKKFIFFICIFEKLIYNLRAIKVGNIMLILVDIVAENIQKINL